MQRANNSSPVPTPARLPMRGEAIVKNWLDFKGYGFLHNPEPDDDRVIFVHAKQVPARVGFAPGLRTGEKVNVTYVQQADGRLRAIEIQFPPHA